MRLNELKPAPGSKQAPKRLGRGVGSGLGKTSGRGHKGQRARAGGYHKVGFEGGQMPIQRRLPKFGFTSRIGLSTTDVRLGDLSKVNGDLVTLETLKEAGIITKNMKRAKIYKAGELTKIVTVSGLRVTVGARESIEAAGGKVET